MRMSRVVRLMRMTAMLQSGRAFSTTELATQFGVSRRTVFRDLRLLEEVGFKKCFDSQAGGHRLSADQETRLPRFARQELLVLLLAAHSSALNQIPALRDELARASTKLLEQCAEPLRRQLIHVLDAWQAERSPALASPAAARVVPQVLDAVRERRQVLVAYRDEDGEPAETRLSPYRVTFDDDSVSLQGYSSAHRRTVAIPLDAIERVEPTDACFTFGSTWPGNGSGEHGS